MMSILLSIAGLFGVMAVNDNHGHVWGVIAFIALASVSSAILTSDWCDALFGRLYLNRAIILHPDSKASHYWNRCFVVFLILWAIFGAFFVPVLLQN